MIESLILGDTFLSAECRHLQALLVGSGDHVPSPGEEIQSLVQAPIPAPAHHGPLLQLSFQTGPSHRECYWEAALYYTVLCTVLYCTLYCTLLYSVLYWLTLGGRRAEPSC